MNSLNLLILIVLMTCQDDYYSSEEELKAQEKRLKKLDRINPDSPGYTRILEECAEFENKYC